MQNDISAESAAAQGGPPGHKRSEGRVPTPANAQQPHDTTCYGQDIAWQTSAQAGDLP